MSIYLLDNVRDAADRSSSKRVGIADMIGGTTGYPFFACVLPLLFKDDDNLGWLQWVRIGLRVGGVLIPCLRMQLPIGFVAAVRGLSRSLPSIRFTRTQQVSSGGAI